MDDRTRTDFERWLVTQWWFEGPGRNQLDRDDTGQYCDPEVRLWWGIWQAATDAAKAGEPDSDR